MSKEIKEVANCSNNPTLNSISTIDWLKKRFNKTTKIQYLNNPSQLTQHYAILNVFKVNLRIGKLIFVQKLDEDNSNSLDIDEVNQMFKGKLIFDLVF